MKQSNASCGRPAPVSRSPLTVASAARRRVVEDLRALHAVAAEALGVDAVVDLQHAPADVAGVALEEALDVDTVHRAADPQAVLAVVGRGRQPRPRAAPRAPTGAPPGRPARRPRATTRRRPAEHEAEAAHRTRVRSAADHARPHHRRRRLHRLQHRARARRAAPRLGRRRLDNLYRRGSELNLPRLKAAGVEFVHGDVRHLERPAAASATFDALVECSAEPSVHGRRATSIVPVNLIGAYHCFEARRAPRRAGDLPVDQPRLPGRGDRGAGLRRGARRASSWPTSRRCPAPRPRASPRTSRSPARARSTAPRSSRPSCCSPSTRSRGSINRCGVVAGPWQMGKVDQGVFTHWMLSALLRPRR